VSHAFEADFQKLPEPGGYLTRYATPPCGNCGRSEFEVVRCERRGRSDDGPPRSWVSVDVQCPRCCLLTARTVVHKQTLGTFDTATGTLALAGGDR
jgi:hypothetical protein